VRTVLSFLFFAFFCLMGCKQTDNPIVAKAFHHNLYLSEVIDKTPYFASKEDSLFFMEQYIDDWILRQTLVARAEKFLTRKEQNFSAQIKQYKEQLLVEAYMQRITNDPSLFAVSINNIDFQDEPTPEYREMVRLNYIKLSNPSKLYKKIKELFFEENDRVKATAQLELLCADTIEYYLDHEQWLFSDILEKEFPFSFSTERGKENKDKLDFVHEDSRYLILVLDTKHQFQPKNPLENKRMLQSMMQQQKKVLFLKDYQDSLVKKAMLEKKVIKYPMGY